MYLLYLMVAVTACFVNVEGRVYTFDYRNIHYSLDVNFKGNFNAAMQFCQQNNMSLLYLVDKNEADAVKYELKNIFGYIQTRIWTSGELPSDSNRWVWKSTGEPITYFDWGTGEPNNDTGNSKCMQLLSNLFKNDGFYDDVDCNVELAAICRKIINVGEETHKTDKLVY